MMGRIGVDYVIRRVKVTPELIRRWNIVMELIWRRSPVRNNVNRSAYDEENRDDGNHLNQANARCF